MTTGMTTNGVNIIPDINIVYSINFLITNEGVDLGFYDENIVDGVIGTDLPIIAPYVVSGGSKSRLNELKKYVISNNFFEQYHLSTIITTNGVDNTKSNVISYPYRVIYYIDSIQYTDIINSGGTGITTYSFTGQGYNSVLFDNYSIYKDSTKENIVENPQINSDVFIDRQEVSAFNDNYKLEHINSLAQLTSYVGGKYFNINNT